VFSFWPDKDNSARFAYFREFGVFGQKTIPWMYRFSAGYLGGAYYPGNIEIAVSAGSGTDTYRFIGKSGMKRFTIYFRIHGDRFDAEFLCCPNNSDRNFAAVSD
jgi:hypothetical protein